MHQQGKTLKYVLYDHNNKFKALKKAANFQERKSFIYFFSLKKKNHNVQIKRNEE